MGSPEKQDPGRFPMLAGDDIGRRERGAVYELFLNADGSVADSRKITAGQGGLQGNPADSSLFGVSVS
jgi:hypothetical protein